MTQTTNQKDDFLSHHGVEGQKWGVRRYQNPDGSLTDEGRAHWGIGGPRKKSKSFRLESSEERRERLRLKKQKQIERAEKRAQKAEDRIVKKKIDLINKGDRQAIYKNRKLFTDEELNYANQRIVSTERFDVEPKAKDKPKTLKDFYKENMILNGDLRSIYKNRKLFTDDEIRSAVARADMLSKMNPDEKKKAQDAAKKTDDGKTFVDKATEKMGKAAKFAAGAGALATGSWLAYNQIASVMNEGNKTFLDDDYREALKDKISSKTNAANLTPISSAVLSFFADTIDGKMPTGVINPFERLKLQNNKLDKDALYKYVSDLTGASLTKAEKEDLLKTIGFGK